MQIFLFCLSSNSDHNLDLLVFYNLLSNILYHFIIPSLYEIVLLFRDTGIIFGWLFRGQITALSFEECEWALSPVEGA